MFSVQRVNVNGESGVGGPGLVAMSPERRMRKRRV